MPPVARESLRAEGSAVLRGWHTRSARLCWAYHPEVEHPSMTTATAEDAARIPFASRGSANRHNAEGFTLVDPDGVSYRIKYWKIETVRHYPAAHGVGNGEEQVQFCTTDRFEFTL